MRSSFALQAKAAQQWLVILTGAMAAARAEQCHFAQIGHSSRHGGPGEQLLFSLQCQIFIRQLQQSLLVLKAQLANTAGA